MEQLAHRERLIHWGPRTLDLDILLYDDEVFETDTLIVPHVEMQLRDFVLRPMAGNCPEPAASGTEKNDDGATAGAHELKSAEPAPWICRRD